MNKIKVLFIIFGVILLLLTIFFFSSMNNFTENIGSCEKNGGKCMDSSCSSIGMQEHVDGECANNGKVYEENQQYCCIRKLV